MAILPTIVVENTERLGHTLHVNFWKEYKAQEEEAVERARVKDSYKSDTTKLVPAETIL